MPYTSLTPGTLLNPAPAVMVSCAAEGAAPNIVTVAWAGTVNSTPPMLSVSLRPERHSFPIIQKSGEFVVNLVGEELLEACDFCGVRSGRDLDKFKRLGLAPLKMEGMAHAPAIDSAPVALGCKVRQTLDLGSHTMFVAEIVSCRVRDDLMDASGKLDLDRARLTAYCHGEYFALGEKLGFFGYSVARPDVRARRMDK